MLQHILVVKESAPQEARVCLVPEDVQQLINAGHRLTIESQAGLASGYSNQAYQDVGATISSDSDNYRLLFAGISIIARAKRPKRQRELEEAAAFTPGQILIGALDPFEDDGHIAEYRQAQIHAYSIDQLTLPTTSPMNILASMSAIAGELALEDALAKTKRPHPHKLLIVGAGTAGLAALKAAAEAGLQTTIVVTHQAMAEQLETSYNCTALVITKESPLAQQQALILAHSHDKDIVITSARSPGQKAPLLFPEQTLKQMLPGSCVVDLALSEGGNVAGSQHDATLSTAGGVIITNVSGYPKAKPQRASQHWSLATRLFIEQLTKDPQNPLLCTALIK